MTLYRVVQPSGVRSRLDVAAGRLTRFVGREVELATLARALGAGAGRGGAERRRHRRSGGRKVTARLPAARAPGVRPAYVARMRRDAVHRGHALPPGHRARGAGTRVRTRRHGRPRSWRRSSADSANAPRRRRWRCSPTLLGLPPPTRLQLSPELQRRKTIELLAQWTLAISAVQPLVLLVEDLHWCDPSSLELLGHLVAQSPTARVLLLVTARPEFTPPWPTGEHMTTLQLARLTERETRDMVRTLAGERAARRYAGRAGRPRRRRAALRRGADADRSSSRGRRGVWRRSPRRSPTR